MFLILGGIIVFLLIAWRKEPIYQEVKKTFIWAIPVLQFYSVYFFFKFFRKEQKPDEKITGIIDILLFIGLVSWQLVSNIGKKVEKKNLHINRENMLMYLYFIYSITIYSNFIELVGMTTGEVAVYWAAVFTGLGVIGLFVGIAKEIGKKYGTTNVNFFTFYFGKIRYTKQEEESKVNLCPNCHSRVKHSDKFCGICGAKLQEEKIID